MRAIIVYGSLLKKVCKKLFDQNHVPEYVDVYNILEFIVWNGVYESDFDWNLLHELYIEWACK